MNLTKGEVLTNFDQQKYSILLKSPPPSILLLSLREYQRYLSVQGAFSVTVREFKDRLHVLPANMPNFIWPHAKSPAASAPAAPADSLLADKFESEPEEKGAIVDRDLIKQTFANFFRNP